LLMVTLNGACGHNPTGRQPRSILDFGFWILDFGWLLNWTAGLVFFAQGTRRAD
jgi:hypothetical protein